MTVRDKQLAQLLFPLRPWFIHNARSAQGYFVKEPIDPRLQQILFVAFHRIQNVQHALVKVPVFLQRIAHFRIQVVPAVVPALGERKRDDILISMAGPAMNVILAILLMAVYRLAVELPIDVGAGAIVHNLELVAFISMILCVFNLIPIPPLDGSHVMRHVVGMSDETYLKIARYGFIILLIAINVFPQLFRFVAMVSIGTIELFKTVLLFQ